MKIVNANPPNYEQICKAIPAVRLNRGIIFTYGAILYVPSGVEIPDHLMAHEETHTVQQGWDVDKWWDRYLTDTEFRLQQEVEAYQNQYAVLLDKYSRQQRRFILSKISEDLSGAMYGKLISKDYAKTLITGGIH